MDTGKIYVDSNKGLLDSTAMASTAAVLASLADNQDDITFSGDADGHFFEVPAALLDKFMEAVNAPKKRGPGRPRKAVDPAVAEAAADIELTDVPEADPEE